MGHWNYRIVRRVLNGEEYFAIHEAFYDKNGKIWAITQDAKDVFSETADGIKGVLDWMLLACNKPILDYDSIPEPGAIEPGPSQEEIDFEKMLEERRDES